MHDVIVVGGGPTGISSAVAAARNGAQVLLVERYGFLGGLSTAGMFGSWATFHDGEGNQIIKGIAQEIVDRLIEIGASPGHIMCETGQTGSVTPFDSEAFKYLCFELIYQERISLLLHSFASGVVMEKEQIRGVKTINESGEQTHYGKIVIDASGDGDIAVLCGADYNLGRAEDEITQPATLIFKMANVNTNKFSEFMSESKTNFFDNLIRFSKSVREDVVTVSVSGVFDIDCNDVWGLTKAELEGARQVFTISQMLKQRVPGFEEAFTINSISHVGVRESKRITGEYTLSEQDLINGNKPEDMIALGCHPIELYDFEVHDLHQCKVPVYGIPLRTIIPKNIKGLIVPGRCISATSKAQTSVNSTPTCMAMGQAAGTAAAMAAGHKNDVREVDLKDLKKALIGQGAILEF